MPDPRGFARCDECEDGWQDCGTGTYDHACPTCSGSGLVPTQKLREEVAGALAEYYGQGCATDSGAIDAVLSTVARHIRKEP